MSLNGKDEGSEEDTLLGSRSVVSGRMQMVKLTRASFFFFFFNHQSWSWFYQHIERKTHFLTLSLSCHTVWRLSVSQSVIYCTAYPLRVHRGEAGSNSSPLRVQDWVHHGTPNPLQGYHRGEQLFTLMDSLKSLVTLNSSLSAGEGIRRTPRKTIRHDQLQNF